ncbi:MAG: DsrE/DsrF/DrsH-like family protein [Thermoleophilia bacterium]|nr:DsrE/DsrF/DrsH-like family protein [Thermoleophilia bacterium]
MDTTKKTIIVFSGDFDKAMAAFIIATGAAAMGDEVTMFFTFWGLSVIRKPEKVRSSGKKSILQSMFGKMMPRGPGKLGLSKMNFGGMGAPLMKKVMKSHNVMTLEELIATAREEGVKLVACTMSMDVLGFSKEELLDDIDYAGVGAYLGGADEANVNLFI